MKLVVYGDFNCPLSYLASARVDAIHAAGLAAIDWRAVERDPGIPDHGRRYDRELADAVDHDLAAVRRRLRPDESLTLRRPSFESNTAAAIAAYASVPVAASGAVRRRLFESIWASGKNVSDLEYRSTVDAPDRVASWRRSWLGLELPAVPMLVLHTGYVARGSVALACLGRLAFTGSLPYRPWAEFRSDVLADRRAKRQARSSIRSGDAAGGR